MLLAEAYRQPAYYELRVKHSREYLRLAKVVGALPGVPPRQL
jgi:hypothetical protein